MCLEGDDYPGVPTGVDPLHPGEHHALQLQVFAPDCLHLVVGVKPRLKLQVGDQLLPVVVGDVDHPVHVVETRPVLVVLQRFGGHEATVKLDQNSVG